MSKLTPEQKRKLEQSGHEPIASDVSEDLANDPAIAPLLQAPSSILQAAKLRQQRELDDLQTQIDILSEEFATRAALIVEQGLTHSYQLARQKIGAIDLSFFDSGDAPETINLLRLMMGKPKFRLDAVMMDLWVVVLVSVGSGFGFVRE